ncbi:DUF6221 family protein [Streptomyces europaeiscabiei]|uniref:DUF6221 family protein n=1 Tax=Streptomyces europaeiscabiei TaxID=146819 RepID=UPI0029BBD488|nr:DUF6221 family protein [Streptomyces europaeiscabiei]MDX3713413.1 DUF6221 family protein [Streptomyces europaeiscabiei]
MDDIAQWLSAQLDEDERIARRAGDSFRQIGETGVIVATEGDRAEECASANWAGVAEHIVAWDPARVLREIDTKRKLLGQYVSAAKSVEDLGAARDQLSAQGRDTLMTGLELESAIHRRDTLRGVLRLLALPYADRPGYREEWRP